MYYLMLARHTPPSQTWGVWSVWPPGSQSRIDLSPTQRPVVNSHTVVTAHWPSPRLSACLSSSAGSSLLHRAAAIQVFWMNEWMNEGLISCWSQMPEPEWMNLVKCGFGVLDRHSLLLCSSCSLKYFDYCELSVTCDCCSQSPGNTHQGLTASPWISAAIHLLRLVQPNAVDSVCRIQYICHNFSGSHL